MFKFSVIYFILFYFILFYFILFNLYLIFIFLLFILFYFILFYFILSFFYILFYFFFKDNYFNDCYGFTEDELKNVLFNFSISDSKEKIDSDNTKDGIKERLKKNMVDILVFLILLKIFIIHIL